MRVLAVGSVYPPRHLGGYEVIRLRTGRHLRDLGHRARRLATTDRGPAAGAVGLRQGIVARGAGSCGS